MSRRLLVFLLAAGLATPAWANYQVRGRFLYRDRGIDPSGFSGIDADLPIRLADVEVVDANAGTVLGFGATDATGTFSIQATDTQTRDVYVRVLSSAVYTLGFQARVVRTSDSAVFALASPTITGHPANQDIDFTSNPVVALQTSNSATIGEPFNIFDQTLDAFDFIASVNGSRPSQLLTLRWEKGGGVGTYYSQAERTIYLLGLSGPSTFDSDGYDDAVILHEIGHYAEYIFSKSDNPGGQHSLNGYYVLPLAWSEGWATFFSNMVRSWRGRSRPDLYVDTNGTLGTGGAFISYSVEAPSVGAPGANNEVTVNAVLWDAVDTPSIPDATPGADDDALALANGPADAWDVEANYNRTATSVSLEDFWDGWFQRGKGHRSEMETIFGARSVEYFPDAFESDATPALAKTVVASAPGTRSHRTTYPAGDEDWFVIAVTASPYTFETRSLLSGADTRLDLFAANGSTLLASNDDKVLGDPSSRIDYTPGSPGLVYLRCKRHTDQHTYGSYDVVVTGVPVAVEVSDVRLAAAPEGVQLAWSAQRDGSFSHFELERGTDPAGPWDVLGTVDASSEAGTGATYSYLDRDVQPGRRYAYRIVTVDTNGERKAFGPFEVETVPARFALLTPYPNPFNPMTTISFVLPHDGRAWLRVYAADGRLVRTLVPGTDLAAGRHEMRWDGRDDAGAATASGVYWFRLDSEGDHESRRGVLVR